MECLLCTELCTVLITPHEHLTLAPNFFSITKVPGVALKEGGKKWSSPNKAQLAAEYISMEQKHIVHCTLTLKF